MLEDVATRNSIALIRVLERVIELKEDELDCIEELLSKKVEIDASDDIIHERDEFKHALVIDSGWAYRYKILPDGRRQVLNFVLPGDFIGLHAAVAPVADHSVTSLTAMKGMVFEPTALFEFMQTCPRVAAAFYWSETRHEAILEEQIVRVGRRSAYERMAHLILEILTRLEMVQQTDNDQFEMPVTQEILADVLGLSIVHVNRTLRRLRDESLIEMSRNSLCILDKSDLKDIAGFSSEYLKGDEIPDETSRLLN